MKPAKHVSSYQERGKRPFKYSPLYYQWHKAAMDGKAGEAEHLARQHFSQYGPHEGDSFVHPELNVKCSYHGGEWRW